MPKERYQVMMAQVHAGNECINRVLQSGKPRRVPLRLAAAVACALVLIISAAFFLTPPPKDIVAATNITESTEDLQPLSTPAPDDLILSVRDVTLVDEHTLSFILTVRGEKVDRNTMISYTIEQFTFDLCTVSTADAIIPPAENERSFQFTLEYKTGPILAQLGDCYGLTITSYTAASQPEVHTLTPDWAQLEYACPQNGEPLVPWTGQHLYRLEDTFDVTGFGLTEDQELIVEIRWHESAGYAAQCIPKLYNADGAPYPLREARHCIVGEYNFYQYTFRVHRDQLPGAQLALSTQLTSSSIEGSWPFAIDLTQLTAE